MSKTYRVGFAALVHDHVWGEFGKWSKLPNVELVAVGDVNPPLLEKAQKDFGVKRLHSSWQEMLEKEELDIVQCASENAVHVEVVEAATAKGCHVVCEKPMAARLSQANRMVAAAEQAGVQLMINWPTAWNPAINTMSQLIHDGAIGQVFYFKQRSAHNGPKEIGCSEYFWKWLYDENLNGAGALMDYCCYAADMMAYFLGLPKVVTGFRGVFVKDYPIPDDNAMIVAKYDHAFGVAEACWTQTVEYATPNPVVYGTEGSIGVWKGKVILQQPGKEPKTIDPPPLPEGRRTGPEYLVRCIETGEPVEGMCSAKVSRNAQEILEAGLRSADSGRAVELPSAL